MFKYRTRIVKCILTLIVLASCLGGSLRSVNDVNAQTQAAATTSEEPRRLGPKPRPIKAVDGTLEFFDRYPLVAIGENHGLQELYDFLDRLVRTPAFADKVNDIVVECGNARFQDVMDRYIAGEDVPKSELQKVWRSSTQMIFSTFDSPIYENLFVTVREVNRNLPINKQIRVLLGDPPIDWSRINTAEEAEPFMIDRDTHYARVVEKEVLRKNRKALMIAGALHFQRPPEPIKSLPNYHPTVTDILEQKYPGKVLRVVPHAGFGVKNDPDRFMERQLETYMTSPWVAYLKGTWLGKTGELQVPDIIIPGGLTTYLEDRWDVVLYLAPGDQLTITEVSEYFYAVEHEYFREKNRVSQIIFGEPLHAYEPHYTNPSIPGIFLREPQGPSGAKRGAAVKRSTP